MGKKAAIQASPNPKRKEKNNHKENPNPNPKHRNQNQTALVYKVQIKQNGIASVNAFLPFAMYPISHLLATPTTIITILIA